MSTTELQARQSLYEEFMSLSKENFAKAERYIRRLSRSESHQAPQAEVMRPLTLEEKMTRLKKAEENFSQGNFLTEEEMDVFFDSLQ